MNMKAKAIKQAEHALPLITNDLWEEFNDTCLMTWDIENNRPHWTQIAVDLVACLPVIEQQRIE